MNELVFDATDETATERFGSSLAAILPPGTTVALCGTLGAGKTRLVQAIAVAYGVPREQVVSPTFVLCQQYHGAREINHLDAYRIRDEDEARRRHSPRLARVWPRVCRAGDAAAPSAGTHRRRSRPDADDGAFAGAERAERSASAQGQDRGRHDLRRRRRLRDHGSSGVLRLLRKRTIRHERGLARLAKWHPLQAGALRAVRQGEV